MVTEIQYTNIDRVLDSLHDHPMLSDITLEQVVRHTIRFISKHGYAKLYQNKQADVEIHDFRGTLPCDLISITQVRDNITGVSMPAMTDSYMPGEHPKGKCVDPMNNINKPKEPWYIPAERPFPEEPAFKTQGRIIYTSFPEGLITIAYRAIPVDENGFPMLIDDETYLDALEAYIKMKAFTVKFDQQKISAGVLQNAQTDYAVASRLLLSHFTLPSPSEMQALANAYNSLIPRMSEFYTGFKYAGSRELLKRQ